MVKRVQPPANTPMVDSSGRVTQAWVGFFSDLCNAVNALNGQTLAASTPYANDTVAKAAGLQPGDVYMNGSVVQIVI